MKNWIVVQDQKTWGWRAWDPQGCAYETSYYGENHWERCSELDLPQTEAEKPMAMPEFVQVKCDGCSDVLGGDDPMYFESQSAGARTARKAGWYVDGRFELCPTCALEELRMQRVHELIGNPEDYDVFRERASFEHPLNGRVKVTANALAVLLAYHAEDTEAGGVLVGRFIKDCNDVVIDEASEPMAGDMRNYAAFHREDPGHQDFIDNHWGESDGTMVYLGSWHTHPKDTGASAVDFADWYRTFHDIRVQLEQTNPAPHFHIIVELTRALVFCVYSDKGAATANLIGELTFRAAAKEAA